MSKMRKRGNDEAVTTFFHDLVNFLKNTSFCTKTATICAK